MLQQLAAPSVYPVALLAAKTWLGELTTDRDGVITAARNAAIARAESFTHLALVARPVRETFGYFPPSFELRGAPLQAVTSIKYLDTAGVEQTLSPSTYRVDKVSAPFARVTPEYGQYFPPTRTVMGAAWVDYDIGLLTPITAVDSNTNVITAPGHHYVAGERIQFSTDGDTASVLPANLTAKRVFFAINPAGDTLQVSATSGGSAFAVGAGFAGTGCFCGALPDDLLMAIRLMVGTWVENRESVSPFQMFDMPAHGAAEALMWPHKVSGF